ncbi:hypothetical protein F4779DRAFT_633970 [Xylariaceae sp. FL0662B]|nr:hypothetical protein F4779DRAFT_633970 [Xylariaceae sp. FL0662B]
MRSEPSYTSYNPGSEPRAPYVRDPSKGAFIPRTDRSTVNAMGSTACSGTSSIASSVAVNDTFDAILASPTSSRTSFESWNSSPRRPEYGWQRPAPIKQRYRPRRKTGELFAALPDEVLELILDELKSLHLSPGSTSCATCMMRDLCSVAVSARKLLKVARPALYENIQLVGMDSQVQRKRYKINFGSRLVLLRRTLRSNPTIAAMVRSLKAPAIPQGVPVDLYQNVVASVIMACPNFERLVGFHQSYDHSFNRLFHALSTRSKLKEMHWVLEASKFQTKRRKSNAAALLNPDTPEFKEAPGDLQLEQSEAFLELHADWEDLTTLSIHCLPGATLTPVSLIPDIVSRLPALQNLHLSHLPFTAFNDANLLSLPPLHTLTLSHLPGVSSEGLSSFARRPSSLWIRKLTLQHIDVDSLPAVAQILSNLTALETFAFVQNDEPIMPTNEIIWLFPYLASPSLRKLHWDITSQPERANRADIILAKSIETDGFPSLRTLRTPNDPDGLFQALCKPLEKIEMASDRYRGPGPGPHWLAKCTSRPTPPATPTTPSTPSSATFKNWSFPLTPTPTPTTPSFFPPDDTPAPIRKGVASSSHLATARMAAQARLEAARQRPRFAVRVVEVPADGDADGAVLVESYGVAGFLGRVGAPLRYCLAPDPGASDENGGLVDVADLLLGDGGEDLAREGREGCTGRWNAAFTAGGGPGGGAGGGGGGGAGADRRERERWWHTERGRWRGIELS